MTFIYGVDDCAQFIQQPAINSFSIVIDRSGSMDGNPMNDAKKAVNHFIDAMRSGDQANIIAFDNSVSVYSDMSTSKSHLKSAVRSIQPGGATALYDAIAKAATLIHNERGARIIVFLTDGDDNSSKFQIKDIENMNLSEGIFIYGIGLGNINKGSLEDLTIATGGSYNQASSSGDLHTIYDRVINTYYSNYGDNLASTSSMTIRSLPSNQTVIINGRDRGQTPLKLDGLKENKYDVQIQFKKGTWECNVNAKNGYRAVMDARESDLGYNLFIASIPKGASVFLDGNYVGMTSIGVSEIKVKKKLFKKNKIIKSFENELKIPLVPRGEHTLRILAVPDMDMGWEYEFNFDIVDSKRSVYVDLFKNKHIFQDGEKGEKIKDPFEKLK